jgi:uncharacterized protein (DUF849 family)
MGEYGVQPEIECFDSGMVNYTKYLISKNILKPPFYMNVILGNIYNAQSDLNSLSAIKSAIPHNVTTCIGGIGNQQLKSNIIGLMEFDGIRIGLEDNLYYKGKIKATNIELLKRAYRIMDELEMECMSSKELRKNGYGNKLIDSRER